MNWKRSLLGLGAAALATMATGCADDNVEDYLGPNGKLYQWQKAVVDAVCQLEEQNPNGLVREKQVCPDGSDQPGEKMKPPTYP